ncbi:MAG: response regulator [Calditrichia bacterium]|nr:response regulator [Calditrichia bacterium]
MQENKENNIYTILTIDDEAFIRKSFRNYLEDFDFNILEAENGKIGLDIIFNQKPDLVLLDLRMPVMGGLEVLAELNKKSFTTPVIVISGAGIISDVVEAIRLGAWDYIIKPIQDITMLLHVINKTLERSQLKLQNIEYQKKLEKAYKQLHDDLQSGKNIQAKLLPKSEKTIGNYLFAYKIIPSMFLSGDFVDYFPIDDNNIAFYSADVSGHGVSSSLITVFLKSFMQKNLDAYKQKINSTILEPAILISNLNTELLNENLDKHIAIFYGIFDNFKNNLTFCNAGQFPNPILLSKNKPEYIQSKGTPAGLLSISQYKSRILKLPEDFTIIILSDGILEILPETPLQDKLNYLCSHKSKEQYEKIFTKLMQENDTVPDDITLLSIQRKI